MMRKLSFFPQVIIINILVLLLLTFSIAQEQPETSTSQPEEKKEEPKEDQVKPVEEKSKEDTEEQTKLKYYPKLQELEEKVIKLKEDIFITKTRVKLLKERIFQNVIAESRAVLIHKNSMSGAFRLEEVLYFFDGTKIYHQDNKSGTLDNRDEFTVFNRSVSPGSHIVSIELAYRGYGVFFTYLNGYHFTIKANFTFHAAKGRITEVKIVGYEKKNFTYSMLERPSVKYEIREVELTQESLSKLKEKEKDLKDKL